MGSADGVVKRIAISPCPNDVYVFAGMLLGEVGEAVEVDFQDVQTLNERAAAGGHGCDLIKISYAAWPSAREGHALLECGGALGRGCGPLLLRNGPGGLDPDAPILAPGAGTTANFLLRFYLGATPARLEFLPFDALYEALRTTPGAQGVVIHEKRFTYARDGLTRIADLGEHWEARTGCPIPLGAIAARRGVDVARAEARVRASVAWADAHPEAALDLCRRHADEMDDAVMRAHIDLYVNDFTRDLGDEGRATVARFLELLDDPTR